MWVNVGYIRFWVDKSFRVNESKFRVNNSNFREGQIKFRVNKSMSYAKKHLKYIEVNLSKRWKCYILTVKTVKYNKHISKLRISSFTCDQKHVCRNCY